MPDRGKIFISYRRDDGAGVALAIRDRLARRFGEDSVFLDVERLMAGVDFERELTRALDETAALVAVIGPRWGPLLAEKAQAGGRDYLADELGAAFAAGVAVIPVLVNGAEMPAQASLPPQLAPLARRQALEIRHAAFARDLDALGDAIAALGVAPAGPTNGPKMSRRALAGAALAGLGLGGAGVFYAARWGEAPAPGPVSVLLFTHEAGLTDAVAAQIERDFADAGAAFSVFAHRDPARADAAYLSDRAPVDLAQALLERVWEDVEYLFPVDYDALSSAEMSRAAIALGLMSNHEYYEGNPAERPYRVEESQLWWLMEEGIDQDTFARRLRFLAPSRGGG